MKPDTLANELMKTLGDADSNTAHTALEIAKLLLIHREHGAMVFTLNPEMGLVEPPAECP